MTSQNIVERVRIALPGYDVGAEIARGGFGVVLFGTHLGLQRKVAIKLLPAEVAHDPDIRHRFAAEARVMAGIDHPHVVPVFDYIENEDLCLFVMEYLPAGTVLSRFTSRGFDPPSAVAVALACASALEAAHGNGILHRDVKPANLMFAANGTVKLSDFGIAKIAGGDGGKTRAEDIIGTAWYISPEQVMSGGQVSPATDIYALSTVLYQLMSGVLPFPPQEDSFAIYFQHVYSKPIPLGTVAPNIPRPLVDVVMRGLETDPKDRWRSAEEFGVALAAAATQCWGLNWLAQAGIPVLGNDSIKAASANISNPPATAEASWPTTGTRSPRPSRPGTEAPDGGLASPRTPYLVTAVLAVAVIVLALVGLGSPARGGNLQPGVVEIAGVDPVTAGDVEVDMSKPVPITVTGMPGDTATLSQDVLGITLGDNGSKLTADGPNLMAELDVLNPHLVAGQMSGEILIRKGNSITGTYRFGIRSTQSAVPTALTIGIAFLALFAVAYIESYTRMLRRGRSRMSARVGLPVATAVLSASIVGAAWVAVGREPTVATLIACASVGVAAGVAGTIAVIRQGQQNLYRRSQRVSRAKFVGGTPRPTRTPGLAPPTSRNGDDTGGSSAGRRGKRGTKIDRD